MDTTDIFRDAPDSYYRNPFAPRRRTSTDQAERDYQASLSALAAPPDKDELFHILNTARGMDKVQAAAALRGAVLQLPEEERAKFGIWGDLDLSVKEFSAFINSHPDAESLVARPEFLSVFGGRLKSVSAVGRLWDSIGPGAVAGGFRRGFRNVGFLHGTAREVWARGDLGSPAWRASYERWRATNQEAADYEDALAASSGRIINLSREFMTNFGDMAGGLVRAGASPEALGGAAAGAGLGAGLGAAAGGVGAGPGALAGAGQGFFLGLSGYQGEAAAGSVLLDAWERLPEDLKAEKLDLFLPALTGLGSMALERVGLGALVKGGGSLAGREIGRAGRAALGAVAPKAAAKVGQAMAGSRLARLGARYVEHMGPEVVTEALQEGLETAAGIPYVQNLAGRFPGRRITPATWPEVGASMGQAAWQTFWGGAWIGAIKPTLQALREGKVLEEIPPEQMEALVERTARLAETSVAIDENKRADEHLRAGVKAVTAEMRQGPEFGENPEAAQALLGAIAGGERTAYVKAEVMDGLLGAALETADPEGLLSELLEPLGVSAEEFQEALENRTDLRLNLNALPQVMNHPLWDRVAENLTAEPGGYAAELEAELASLGEPPVMLERAGADVTPETRQEIEGRLSAAGRTKAQAGRETETLARMWSILSRIAGADPNKALLERIIPGKEGQAGAGALHQPGREEVKAAETRRKFDASPVAEATGKEIADFSQPQDIQKLRGEMPDWAKNNGVIGFFSNDDTGWKDIEVSRKSIKESMFHGAHPEKIQVVAALPALIKSGVHLESHPDRHGKPLTDHVFAAKLNIADKAFVIGFVIKEDSNGKRYYNHEMTTIENLDGLQPAPGAASRHGEVGRSGTHQGMLMSIVKKHLGVNPDLTLNQSAPAGPRGWTDVLSDDTFRIIFTESADGSTAVHEFEHVFIIEALRLLSLPPEQIADQAAFETLKKDMARAAEWAGVKDGVWTVAAHEKMARALESYMLTGQAPVSALKRLFSQMKRWIMEAYKGLSGSEAALEIPDDIKEFFDRQLATEEEIALERWRFSRLPETELEFIRAEDPAGYGEYKKAADKAAQAARSEIIKARNLEAEDYSEAPISGAEIELWEKERDLLGRRLAGSDYRSASARELKYALERRTALKTVAEISRRSALDLKAKLKAQARAAREGYEAGRKIASAEGWPNLKLALERAKGLAAFRLLEKRLELGLKYKNLVESQRLISKLEAQAERLLESRPEELAPEYYDQIRNLLVAVGVPASAPGEAVRTNETLSEFAARQAAEGAPLAIADWLIQGRWPVDPRTGRRLGYRGLKMAEFQDLSDAVGGLISLGRGEKATGRLAGEAGAARISQPSPGEIKAADEALARDSEAWGTAVDGVAAAKAPPHQNIIMLRQTPLILRLIGTDALTGKNASDGGLYVSPHTFQNALNGRHGVTLDMLKQIPEAMVDPIAIFDSVTGKGDVVFMLELKDAAGKTVIAPVALRGTDKNNIEVNVVKSAYGKGQNIPNHAWFAEQAKTNARYINGQKFGRWQEDAGVQFSSGYANDRGNIIRNETDLVKLREANPRFYQPARRGGPQSGQASDDERRFNERGVAATSREEKQKKIDSVKIDFGRDNTLPGLNAEDLAKLGKQDKPVLLKKSIIEKNENHHPDVTREETAKMIGQALYDPDLITPGHKEYPYFNFISQVGPDKSTVALLEMAETKDNYEIVNWHWAKDKKRNKIIRKGEKISNEN